jgi:hypothetical protein
MFKAPHAEFHILVPFKNLLLNTLLEEKGHDFASVL